MGKIGWVVVGQSQEVFLRGESIQLQTQGLQAHRLISTGLLDWVKRQFPNSLLNKSSVEFKFCE